LQQLLAPWLLESPGILLILMLIPSRRWKLVRVFALDLSPKSIAFYIEMFAVASCALDSSIKEPISNMIYVPSSTEHLQKRLNGKGEATQGSNSQKKQPRRNPLESERREEGRDKIHLESK
jgi:hypothetical protein